MEIVLSSYPGGEGLGRPVSLDGGIEPKWMASGDLFYRKGNHWFVTHVSTSTRPSWTAPRPVFSTDFIDTPGMSYDVFPDGQHLLVVKRVRPVERTRIEILVNWPAVLHE